MDKIFYDDLYLYETIKTVTGFRDTERILPIFTELYNREDGWRIEDIEELASRQIHS